MKKTYLSILACATVALFGFTSCDEDTVTGMVLSGEWEGDFGMYYDYEDYNGYHTADCFDSYLDFIPYTFSYTSGYGYETDYYDYGPYSEIYHAFTWEVRNQTIYIDYCSPEDAPLNTYLREYDMTNSTLTGYFADTNSRFTLHKFSDYYDWTPYINTYGDYNTGRGHGFGYIDNRDYARTRSAESVENNEVKILHYGNRYVDNRD